MEEIQLRIGFALLHGGKATWRFILAWFRWYYRHFVPMLLLTIAIDVAGAGHIYWLSDGAAAAWLVVALYGAVATAHSMRHDARHQRHAACLARIAEIEADALMPLDDWMVLEMQRREVRTVMKDARPTMAEAANVLALMTGYHPESTQEAKMLKEARRQRIAAAQRFIASEREDPHDPRDDDQGLRLENIRR